MSMLLNPFIVNTNVASTIPTLVSTGTAVHTSSGTTLTPSIPAGGSPGDVAVLFSAVWRGQLSITGVSAGWDQKVLYFDGTDNIIGIWTKVLTGSDDNPTLSGTPTLTGRVWSGVIHVFSGVSDVAVDTDTSWVNGNSPSADPRDIPLSANPNAGDLVLTVCAAPTTSGTDLLLEIPTATSSEISNDMHDAGTFDLTLATAMDIAQTSGEQSLATFYITGGTPYDIRYGAALVLEAA